MKHILTLANTSGWGSLSVVFSGPAVLHQLLHAPSVQRGYSSLFAFLLCVRRAQHRLHSCWITHRKDVRLVVVRLGCLDVTES